ncbi:MAG: cell division protein SepF [Caldiserica bacterium]|nr:cell division protein SepF [Caldisericota bacterium]MDH7562982.1 cell division protein SepF [Caldisericota bacterium]
MNWLKKFFGTPEEPEEEDERVENVQFEKEPLAPERKQSTIVLFEPESFDEGRKVADNLKARKPVVVNLEKMDHETARRCIDFLSGTIYALNGSVEKIAESVFLFAPSSVTIEETRRKSWDQERPFDSRDLFPEL